MSRPKSNTWEYHVRGWIFGCNWQCQGQNPMQVNTMSEAQYLYAIDNVKAKIQHKGIPCQRLNILIQLTMSRPKSNTREYHVRGWIFSCNWQSQGQNPTWVNTMLKVEYFDAIDIATIQYVGIPCWRLNIWMQLTMSRPKSNTRQYHVRDWICWCNWQCQGQNPIQGNTMLEVEYLDAIGNVKAKIQHKWKPCWILNTMMQLTMSRPTSNTREYHIRDWIFGCNQQCQGQNPTQRNTMLEVEYFDAIDNVKAKIQNQAIPHQRLNILMELTMSRPKYNTSEYHVGFWILWCNWQHQGQNTIQGNTMSEVEYLDVIDNLKAKIQNQAIPC